MTPTSQVGTPHSRRLPRPASFQIKYQPGIWWTASHLPRPRILVVDDEPHLLRIVSIYLTMKGFDVSTAPDGRTALTRLQIQDFALVMLDVTMPSSDGVDVCRHIRDDPRTQSLPILLFTSLSSEADAERARVARATHLITKPFSLSGLDSVIGQILGRELVGTSQRRGATETDASEPLAGHA